MYTYTTSCTHTEHDQYLIMSLWLCRVMQDQLVRKDILEIVDLMYVITIK